MRYPASEKLEIIRLVERSPLPAKRSLEKLGIPRTTFYRWYDRYLALGEAGLVDRPPQPGRVWNRIPDAVRRQIVDLAKLLNAMGAHIKGAGSPRIVVLTPGPWSETAYGARVHGESLDPVRQRRPCEIQGHLRPHVQIALGGYGEVSTWIFDIGG